MLEISQIFSQDRVECARDSTGWRFVLIEKDPGASFRRLNLENARAGEFCIAIGNDHLVPLMSNTIPGANCRCDYALGLLSSDTLYFWLVDMKSSSSGSFKGTQYYPVQKLIEAIINICTEVKIIEKTNIRYCWAAIVARRPRPRPTTLKDNPIVSLGDNKFRIYVDAIDKGTLSLEKLRGNL